MQGKCCPSQPAIKAYNADAFAAIENSTFDWCTPDRRSGSSRHRKGTAVEDPAARVTGCRGRLAAGTAMGWGKCATAGSASEACLGIAALRG